MSSVVAVGQKPRPPVKWAGGKTQLLSQLRPLFPPKVDHYAEPFLGGGAVFLDLLPPRAVLIDSNPDLVNLYLVIRDSLESLLEDLSRHENTSQYFYRIRQQDPATMSRVARASRFLYLNKTSYNGLWRVNSKGQFNVPFGHYRDPKIFDPPYHPLTTTAKFTGYTKDSFGEEDQRRLVRIFRQLDEIGCRVMLSNSNTKFIRDLYEGFTIDEVCARRAINCRADARGPIIELVVRNYS